MQGEAMSQRSSLGLLTCPPMAQFPCEDLFFESCTLLK